MDNLGDWLYIVLLVIAGASSLLTSGKKKKRSSTPSVPTQGDFIPDEEPHASGSFWDVFDEQPAEASHPSQPHPQPFSLTPVPDRKHPQIHKKTSLFSELQKNDSQKKKQKESMRSSSVSSPFLTGESHFSNHIPNQSPIRIQSVEEESGIMPENTFSDVTEIRRAIICAEILNRKYE